MRPASTYGLEGPRRLVQRVAARFVDAGQLKVAEVRTYPLEQAAEALAQLDMGTCVGRSCGRLRETRREARDASRSGVLRLDMVSDTASCWRRDSRVP
jgi:hypothetical protein